MRKTLRGMIGVGAIGVVVFAGLTTAASAGPGAAKEALVGPDAQVSCQTVQPADNPQPGPGFVIFNQDGSGGVHANVVLKGAAPDTTYVVRLIQAVPNGSDCGNVDGTITTNGQGNGNVNIIEPKLTGATAAQVIIDTGNLQATPTYRGSHLFQLS